MHHKAASLLHLLGESARVLRGGAFGAIHVQRQPHHQRIGRVLAHRALDGLQQLGATRNVQHLHRHGHARDGIARGKSGALAARIDRQKADGLRAHCTSPGTRPAISFTCSAMSARHTSVAVAVRTTITLSRPTTLTTCAGSSLATTTPFAA